MRDPPSCRGQALPDPPARQGRQNDAKGCGGAATIAAGAVARERPGLKPRAQSASPLKGAVRRTGARVDRPGAGAVGISRLQPAWGLSPAVHGRAIVETGARLVCAACRARRVGHDASPRHAARASEAAPRLYKVGQPIPGGAFGCDGWGAHARLVGVRRCLARRPGRAGKASWARWGTVSAGSPTRTVVRRAGCRARRWAAPGCRPAPRRPATAVATVPHTPAAVPSWLAARPAIPETIHHPRTL